MRSPIVLYTKTNPTTGDVQVTNEAYITHLGVDADALLAMTPGLKRETITLKEKIEQAQQAIVDAVSLQAPERRKAALVEQYVEAWTLPGKPCAATFDALDPNVADKIAFELERRIFPGMAEDPDFLASIQTLRAQATRSSQAETTLQSS